MTSFNTFTRAITYPIPASSTIRVERISFTQILLMYFVLMISGNPYCVQNYSILVLCSVAIPLMYVFTNAHRKMTYKTIWIFTFFLGYELMHAWIYSLDYSFTIFKLFLVLLLAFSTVQIIGDRFVKVLVDTMCIIALVSFVFTALCYIPSMKWKMYNLAIELFPMQGGFKGFITPTLLVYTLHPQYYSGEFSYVRNAGIFWESGAFAVFLNITLFLHYISKNISQLRDLFDKKSIVLIIAVISTASTMGFLSLMGIVTFFTMNLRTPVKYIFFMIVLGVSYVSFMSIDFLGDKIATQLEESDERNNRFGAALMDWQDIKKRPIIGSSRRLEVIYGNTPLSNEMRRPNGLTNFLREYGIIYFTAYFILVFYSFKRIFYYTHRYYKFSFACFGILLLWMSGFSELIFDLPFFKAFVFLGSSYVGTHHSVLSERKMT